VTQPSVSYHVKKLELELGVRLFHRGRGGAIPTNAGRLLARHALVLLDAVGDAKREIGDLAEGVSGEVRIGSVESAGVCFLARVLEGLRERHPGVRPNLFHHQPDKVMDVLLDRRVDVALVADPPKDRRLQAETILKERVSLVCGRPHPLFGRRDVSPRELGGHRLVLLENRTPTGRLVRRSLARLGLDQEPVVSAESVETVKQMALAGVGLAFLPDMVTAADVACGEQPTGRLTRLRVGRPIVRRLVLVMWRGRPVSRAVRAFVDELRDQAVRWKQCLDPAEANPSVGGDCRAASAGAGGP